jgi:hypothetical protein
MRDASFIVAIFGALFLLCAAGVWWKVVRKPGDRTPDRAGVDSPRAKSAAMAVVIAFALSGLAAVLAIIGWVARG